MTRRPAMPPISENGCTALEQYAGALQDEADMRPATVRNYLSDLRQFVAWCEEMWSEGHDELVSFTPTRMTTPMFTRYRAYLQHMRHLRPATVNRALVSIKRYCAWALVAGHLPRNPAAVVKLVGQEAQAPRQISDQEEEALVAAVTAVGSLRDQTIITLMLHTGLRASEVCQLGRDAVMLGRRSGTVQVVGKRNKYREVPLNATARKAVREYLVTLPATATCLFPSEKTGAPLTERALGYVVQRIAAHAHVIGVSPHDLRHRFAYRMADVVPLHRLAQIMGHHSLDTTMVYMQATRNDLQSEVEKIAWA